MSAVADSAAVNVVSDTIGIAPHVQPICVTADSQKAHGEALLRAFNQFGAALRRRSQGVILNFTSRRWFRLI